MKKAAIYLTVITAILWLSNYDAFSQTSKIEIDKFIVMCDTITPDTVSMTIFIDWNEPRETQKLYLKVGNAKDDASLLNRQILITETDKLLYLDTETKTFKIFGTSGICNFKLNSVDLDDLKWATIYAEDKDENLSEKAYCEIKKMK